MVSYSILGVSIIPKWLILTPGHIAILFRSFFGTSKVFTKSGPLHRLFITKTLQNIQENIHEHIWQNIIFTYMHFYFCQLWERRAPKNPEESSNQLSKIWDLGPISIKKYEWNFANMVPISTTKHNDLLGLFLLISGLFS